MVRTCPSCGTKNRIPPSKAHHRASCGKCKTPIAPLDVAVTIESKAAFDTIVSQSKLPVVVDFWAPWCGPCRAAAPEVSKLAQKLKGKALVAKVDTESLPSVAARFGVQGVPTFMVVKDGREVTRVSGAMPADQLAQSLGVA